jgi:hypothetical protein
MPLLLLNRGQRATPGQPIKDFDLGRPERPAPNLKQLPHCHSHSPLFPHARHTSGVTFGVAPTNPGQPSAEISSCFVRSHTTATRPRAHTVPALSHPVDLAQLEENVEAWTLAIGTPLQPRSRTLSCLVCGVSISFVRSLAGHILRHSGVIMIKELGRKRRWAGRMDNR